MEWKVTKTDRGTGLTCPRDECDGKLIVNPDLVKSSRQKLGLQSLVCPYCEHVSMLPSGKKKRRKR